MKPISSAITTIQSKAVTATGMQRGARGLATRENSERVAAWLSAQAPEDMDKAAVSRASSHGVGLRVRFEGRYPVDADGNRLPSYTVAVGCDMHGTEQAAQAALNDLRNFMTPAPMWQIEEWIARLSVVTAKRRDDAFSEELRVVEYSSRLSRYPADVVRKVILGGSYKFFPTWDELHKQCEALTSPRRCMIAALERGPEPDEPDRRPPTQAERDRIQGLVDEMFPSRSPEMRRAAVDEALRGDCFIGEPDPDAARAGYAPKAMHGGKCAETD